MRTETQEARAVYDAMRAAGMTERNARTSAVAHLARRLNLTRSDAEIRIAAIIGGRPDPRVLVYIA